MNTSRMLILNSSNLSLWKGKMLDLLYCKEWHAPFECEEVKLSQMNEDKWKLLNRQVVGFIRQWVNDNFYHHVENETSAHTLCHAPA